MNKVTTIHLAGRAYQLEESGYDLLRRYLDEAALALADNPDRDEIIGDLEQALAEKCQAYLGEHKDVIVTREVEQMIAEMGPVRGDASDEDPQTSNNPGSGGSRDSAAPKKLYQILQGAWISGVCTGVAAYFNLDVALVRIIFVVLTLLTHGAMILVYILMMIIVPHADTPGERAQAFGTNPITAQDLVDRAKEGYEHFKNSDEWRGWKRQMQQEARGWKQQWRQERRSRRQYGRAAQWHYSPFWEFMHMVMGLIWTLVIGFCIWYAYYHFAPVHQFIDLLPQWATQAASWVKHEWVTHV